MNLELKEIAMHRNGVAGEPFYAILFFDPDQPGADNKSALMLATLFEKEGACAVVQLNKPGPMTIAFGRNSWRGDHYEETLRAWAGPDAFE